MGLRKVGLYLYRNAGQFATAGAIAGLGDLTMQRLEGVKSASDVDWPRTGRIVLFRSVFFAPPYLAWMQMLEHRLKHLKPVQATVSKVLLDQFGQAWFAMGLFFGGMSLLEGNDLETSYKRIEDNMMKAMVSAWVVWIPLQTFTFAFVPMRYRMAWISVSQVGWNAYLSGMNQKSRVADSMRSSSGSSTSVVAQL